MWETGHTKFTEQLSFWNPPFVKTFVSHILIMCWLNKILLETDEKVCSLPRQIKVTKCLHPCFLRNLSDSQSLPESLFICLFRSLWRGTSFVYQLSLHRKTLSDNMLTCLFINGPKLCINTVKTRIKCWESDLVWADLFTLREKLSLEHNSWQFMLPAFFSPTHP